MSILCQDFENTPDERRVKVWITSAAKQALLEMCATLPLSRFRGMQSPGQWEAELDDSMYAPFEEAARRWNCTVSDAIIMIHKQEHV